MKKSYAILIVALLMLPMLTVAVPVRASTGHPQLASFDGGTTVTLASFNATIRAGEEQLTALDGVPDTGYFAIVFNATGHLVDFSGAVFDVYMSKDGYSALNATSDVKYAGSFNVADLSQVGLKDVNVTNSYLKDGMQTFHIGTIGGYQVLVGPIPFDISSEYKYIKIFDGSTFVAVAGIVEILPAFVITPDTGAACTTVTLSGVALAPNTTYNITYGFKDNYKFVGYATSNADGKLSFTWQILDEQLNETEGPTVGDTEWIGIRVWNNATGIEQTYSGQVTFEQPLSYLTGLSVDGGMVTPLGFGNNTGPYDVYVFSDLVLNGSYFCVSCGHVTISIDGTTVGTATLNSDGNFTAEFVIPILSNGNHVVKVTDCSKAWTFNITVLPTLIATPDHGPIGTKVTFTAYGFPANTAIFLYWEDDSLCANADNEEFWIANATTGADGQFNVTVTTTVVTQPGGSHDIDAFDTFYNTTQMQAEVDDENSTAEISGTEFLVTPTLWATPSTFATDGGLFFVMGNGFNPSVSYNFNIDNQYSSVAGYVYRDNYVYSDDCGNLNITFVAAGFAPGTHVASAYYTNPKDSPSDLGVYEPAAYALFTVTGANDPLYKVIGQINTTVTNLNAQLVSIQGNIATLNTSVGTIQGTVTSIKGDTATIVTNLGTLSANVATIKGFLPVDLTPVWIAVILSLIAAIASIYGIIVIRSKIAA